MTKTSAGLSEEIYITIQLVNQTANWGHKQRTLSFDDRSDCVADRVTEGDQVSVGWGISQFISHSHLQYDVSKNTEYLKNDTLEFRVIEMKLERYQKKP